MKKNIKYFSIAAAIFTLTSIILCGCGKDNKVTKKPEAQDESITKALSRVLGNELLRLQADVDSPDYEIAITNNPNFGLFSPSGSDIYLSGMTVPDDHITIRLNDNVYSPASDGQWLQQSASLAYVFGTDLEVLIKAGSDTLLLDSIYVTGAHITPRLETTTCCGLLSRTGKTLSWTPDVSAKSLGKIAFFYRLYDANYAIIEQDIIMLDDDGGFGLDDILDNSAAKKITFQLVSGNAIATTYHSKKILFYAMTADQHEYDIEP